jgi:hypothetical protein
MRIIVFIEEEADNLRIPEHLRLWKEPVPRTTTD